MTLPLHLSYQELHVGGGLSAAFRKAKETGGKVYHMHPDGKVTACWYEDGRRRRQRVRATVLPWSRPDADVLGDIRRTIEAMEAEKVIIERGVSLEPRRSESR